MMTKQEKDFIRSLWTSTGRVSYKTSKYTGKKFGTYREYLNLLSEHYSITESVDENGKMGYEGILKSMVDYGTSTVNEWIMCNNEIECTDIEPTFDVDSNSTMEILYNRIGGIVKITFKYSIDTQFVECPDDYDEPIDYEYQCHDDACVVDPIRKTCRDIESRYGIRLGNVHYSYYEK